MKTLKFYKEPTFADLWDACLHNFLYDKNAYVNEILALFRSLEVDRSAKILDTCAGTGFISLYLREKGFNVDCMDLMDDEVQKFKENAGALEVSPVIRQLAWEQMSQVYSPGSYDFLFCRGNSFIYANGGWNESQKVDENSSLRAYEETLKFFYEVLAPGGFLYIDKFPDSERSYKQVVARIRVGDTEEHLIFYGERDSLGKSRRAGLQRKLRDGKLLGLLNVAYDLRESQLEELMEKVGFRNIRKVNLSSEKHFVVWLAQK